MRRTTGRCLCGKIQYEIRGDFGPAFNCHCSKCRRWHGSAFRSRASIERQQFHWISGEELLGHFDSSENVTKTFCSVCGSNLISSYKNKPNALGIPLGGLDQHPGVTPQAHIFTKSKSPWYEITDELPCYEQWPETEAQVRKTRAE